MLSIIIPHYNTPHRLRRLLKTIPVIDQIEVVVIDDNSDHYLDELESVINDFYEHTFLKNYKPNKGAGACRNIGLENASGDWVLFGDADDYFLDSFFQKVEKYFDTPSDLVYFCLTSIQEDTHELSNRHKIYENLINNYLENSTKENELKLRYEYPSPCSKMIRMDLIKRNEIRFDELMVSNDVMFSTQVGYYASKITASDKIIYCITESIGTLTKTMSEANFDTRLSVRINKCIFLKDKLSSDELKYINTSGRDPLVNVYYYKMGVKKFVGTYVKLKKNRIEILELRYFNPIFLFNRIKKVYINDKKNKKYIKRV